MYSGLASTCGATAIYKGFYFGFQVEKLFRKSVEFCNESDIWKLNVAHVLFMQENKFSQVTDAILHKRSNGG